ncbi:MAG: Regulatory protein RecX [Candidatus Daviesbacteria bacterium GW2011_GWB1_36_5]|uniref:Regulatory protein RecX n=1 Tax=Candidatus Daviesbacteria bacterium GW2011_GWB1_36_5 TaxID=1618426 RepID=A0A0G0HVI6_9BACT|nr:MAG: Regulatory protein RecX [Candidatus Daviesbacteria bacterium GW2011_GWB1_36_5]
MKITQVDQQKRNPKERSPADLEKILFETEVGKLMVRVYTLLNIRLRTEKEIRDYMRALSFKRKVKGDDEISEMVIESLIEKLKQKKLLDDEVFAREWVRSRRASKKKGNIALKAELFLKGVDRSIIETVLEEEGNSGTQENLAGQALEKKMKSFQALPYLEKKKKALEFLMRRGFDYSISKEVVEKFLEK